MMNDDESERRWRRFRFELLFFFISALGFALTLVAFLCVLLLTQCDNNFACHLH